VPVPISGVTTLVEAVSVVVEVAPENVPTPVTINPVASNLPLCVPATVTASSLAAER